MKLEIKMKKSSFSSSFPFTFKSIGIGIGIYRELIKEKLFSYLASQLVSQLVQMPYYAYLAIYRVMEEKDDQRIRFYFEIKSKIEHKPLNLSIFIIIVMIRA